ncbi:hypothetical protein N7509_001509 [Penicillium cosmopolitanum]|uniref:Zn(2)-C6 fungal-type domain-containing protein n=1 Tax=Penicillium cosmopolitanum TaxID=1131564 RepID=A0A9X0BCJ7_9EURO|nr:uncharacterized protein N7509_001509 [Penicillium cosmopolitanum]KAJ5407626.1 hypothetical protein N7509_001509 [Penicillium cosmopolitanum]
MADHHDFHHEESGDPARMVQRRRRPPLSCTECRRRKLKCDRSLPCGQCIRSKTADCCVFVGPQPVTSSESSHRMSPPLSRTRLPNGHDDQSQTSGGMFVFDAKLGPKSSSNRTPETSISDVYSEITTSQNSSDALGVDDRVRFLPDSSFRGKKGKTRYFGRSHYTTTVSFFQDIGSFLRRGRNNCKDAEYTDMKKFKCDLWSRESKDHQSAFREQAFKLDEMVPSREVADQLLGLYLDTFETTFRILHIPTFLKQYADYWATGQKSDSSFIAQLLAVMAAGSCFYTPSAERDDRDSYQNPAMKWIMAVQSYISCTFVSPSIDFKMIQTQCLLLVARLGVAGDGDVAWASSGSLIRSAITMGLNRDPSRFRKAMSPFWAELRRRLWMTIVELDLKISLDRGVPPSVDLDECDCDAPSNWDDNEMFEKMEHSPTESTLTNTSQNFYQTILVKTLPLRYRIARKINTLNFNLSYDDALRMGEELLRSTKHASSLFDDHTPDIDPIKTARHRFAQSLHLFLMRKFLLALHRPFSLSVARLPKCSYSRKVCLEVSLDMLSQMELPPSPQSIQYPHITQLGSGMFRDEIFHAAITVCVELSLQAQEMSQSLGPTMEGVNSSVLMSMVQSQQSVMLQAVDRTMNDFGRRIGPSGKGCKPYFFLTLILASVKSRIKGEDPMVNVEASSKRAVRVCRTLLNGVSYADALIIADRQAGQTPVLPASTTPASGISNDFDLPSLFSADLGDFTPLDLGGWFDNLDYSGTEPWDGNLFGGLPSSI